MISIIFPLILLLVLTTMIIISLEYQFIARLFPLLVMLPVGALLVAQIFLEFRAKAKQKTAPEERGRAPQASLGDYLKSQVWIIALLLAIYLLGFVAGPALFLLTYLKLHGVKWFTTTICIAVVIALVYVGFGLLFEVYLYQGLLFSHL